MSGSAIERLRRHRLTVDEYHSMAGVGILRCELLEAVDILALRGARLDLRPIFAD